MWNGEFWSVCFLHRGTAEHSWKDKQWPKLIDLAVLNRWADAKVQAFCLFICKYSYLAVIKLRHKPLLHWLRNALLFVQCPGLKVAEPVSLSGLFDIKAQTLYKILAK